MSVKDLLAEDELHALEGVIGAGMVEFGRPWPEDDPIVRACRALKLKPRDWHGDEILEDLAGVTSDITVTLEVTDYRDRALELVGRSHANLALHERSALLQEAIVFSQLAVAQALRSSR